LQKNSGLLSLSPLEISEIVFIACMRDGEDGAGGRYAEACKRTPEILIPIETQEFKTLKWRLIPKRTWLPNYCLRDALPRMANRIRGKS
jgi:hypothetical protein